MLDICPSFKQKYIPTARARISGNQLSLSEPRLGGRASMSTEQVKCSCGSVSSKAAPSIKLNKRGSTACTNSACSWRQTSLHSAFGFENRPFHSFFAFMFFPSHANTLIHNYASDSPSMQILASMPEVTVPAFPALILPGALSQTAFQT